MILITWNRPRHFTRTWKSDRKILTRSETNPIFLPYWILLWRIRESWTRSDPKLRPEWDTRNSEISSIYGCFCLFFVLWVFFEVSNFSFWVWFWVLDKNSDFQKYNWDNQIKFRMFFMALDQILDKISHIFEYLNICWYLLCVLIIFLGWTQHDPNRIRSVIEPNPNQQTLISTLFGPTI